jgi:broad specificity phosphatase PhoE
MQVFSIYKSMQKSAALCPRGCNVKLILRHTIRYDIAGFEADKNIQLREEGKIMAQRLGESLDMPVGIIASSLSPRCLDTCAEIIKGIQLKLPQSTFKIKQEPMLQVPQNADEVLAGKTFKEAGNNGEEAVRNIFQSFVDKRPLPGLFDLNTATNRLLKAVFDFGNKDKELDIFCTHDFQLAMLLLYLFGGTQDAKNALFNGGWPLMLEGIFLWKQDNAINGLWRGDKILSKCPCAV